jgi:hypothetical protein
MTEFETVTIDNVAWIVRTTPDGRRQRVGRQRDLDATVDAICATLEYGTYEASVKVWKDRADLQRRAKLARGESDDSTW